MSEHNCPYERLPVESLGVERPDARWKCPLCGDVTRAYPRAPTRRCPQLRTQPDGSPPPPVESLRVERRLSIAARLSARAETCIHRGPELRRQGCNTCQGETQVKIFACPLHRECTIGLGLPEIQCCAACGDYETSG